MKRIAKKKYFEDLVSSKQSTKSIWSAINQLTNKSNDQSSSIKDISPDQLNTHFSTIADQIINQNTSNLNNLDRLNLYCASKQIRHTVSIPHLTVLEVFNSLNRLKQSGTRGLDGLDGKILKLSAPFISDTLTYIYNLCIDKNTFPKQFKHAKVIPLFKSGDKSDPSNYRPISILSILSKPLENHLNRYITKHFETFDLLHKRQSGFRKNHSCHTALITLVDQWLCNINEKKFCGALFLDFAKAFDVIDHNLLLKKLSLYGVKDTVLEMMNSFLSNRQQTVYVNSCFSSSKTIKYGIPQGSVLGPLLFSIYINDLPLYINNCCELFCDDATIHASHENLSMISTSLQNDIFKLVEWCKLNHMSLTPPKNKNNVYHNQTEKTESYRLITNNFY